MVTAADAVYFTRKRYPVVACLLAALIVVALFVVSCGDKGTKTGEPDTGDTPNGREVSIDGTVRELDADMNSVNPEDFSDSRLDDSQLGL